MQTLKGVCVPGFAIYEWEITPADPPDTVEYKAVNLMDAGINCLANMILPCIRHHVDWAKLRLSLFSSHEI